MVVCVLVEGCVIWSSVGWLVESSRAGWLVSRGVMNPVGLDAAPLLITGPNRSTGFNQVFTGYNRKVLVNTITLDP